MILNAPELLPDALKERLYAGNFEFVSSHYLQRPGFIQNAGHTPWPFGILMRASKRPYCCENFPDVFNRADVYWQVPYQQECEDAPAVVAVMTSEPPRMTALLVPLV